MCREYKILYRCQHHESRYRKVLPCDHPSTCGPLETLVHMDEGICFPCLKAAQRYPTYGNTFSRYLYDLALRTASPYSERYQTLQNLRTAADVADRPKKDKIRLRLASAVKILQRYNRQTSVTEAKRRDLVTSFRVVGESVAYYIVDTTTPALPSE